MRPRAHAVVDRPRGLGTDASARASLRGLRLLERQGRSVRPTNHGLQLLEMIRPLLSGLDTTRDVLHQRAGAEPAELFFTTDMRILVDQVSEALQQFQVRHPRIVLHIRYTSHEEVTPRVLRSESDVTLSLEPRPDVPLSTALEYEPAGETDYLLVMPIGHPLAGKRALHLHHILDHPLVLTDPNSYPPARAGALHRYDLAAAVRVVAETSSDVDVLARLRGQNSHHGVPVIGRNDWRPRQYPALAR